MFNMVKLDIRRMFHCRSFYLALLIFLLFSGYCLYSQTKWQVINGYELPQHLQLEGGLYSIVNYYFNTTLPFMYTFTLKNGLIIFGIFITSFVADDYQSGFIRNKCTMCKNKSTIIWSKLIVSIVLSVIILVLSFVLTTVLGYVFVSDFQVGNIYDILVFSLTALLLYVAYFTGLSLLYHFAKGKIPSVILSVVFPLGMVAYFLEPLLGEYVKYSLSGVFLNFPMLFQSSDSYFTIIMCIIFITLYHGLHLFLFHKRDI